MHHGIMVCQVKRLLVRLPPPHVTMADHKRANELLFLRLVSHQRPYGDANLIQKLILVGANKQTSTGLYLHSASRILDPIPLRDGAHKSGGSCDFKVPRGKEERLFKD